MGANYGYFSCLWAAQNPQNSVFAFEASPINIEPLSNNINKNKQEDRIKIISRALGKEKGKLMFSLETDDQQTGWGGFTMKGNSSSLEVEVDTLDDYCLTHNMSLIDVLKIDTEGADTWVLYGAERLLEEKKIKHIFFEQNLPRMKMLNIGENEAFDYLQKFGYVAKLHSPGNYYACPKR